MKRADKARDDFADAMEKIFTDALVSVGVENLELEEVQIARAFIAEGYFHFQKKNARRTSAKGIFDWMHGQAM